MATPNHRYLTAIKVRTRALFHGQRVRWRRARLAGHLAGGRPAVIDLHVPGMGLFAHLSWVLLGLDWAERHGHRLHFRCTNSQYNPPGRHDDWLGLVVEQSAPAVGREFRIGDYGEFPFAALPLGQGRERVRTLLRERLRPNPSLVADSDRWFAERIGPGFALGLHYRGTDKRSEAPRLPYEAAFGSVNRLVAGLAAAAVDPITVFVATDEAAFLAAARQEIRGARVLAQEQVLRATGPAAVHAPGGRDGPRLVREAMADALLLSRCDVLVKTASALSGWSALLGKAMPVLFLNRPHGATDFYPDSMLAAESFALGEEPATVASVRAARNLPA